MDHLASELLVVGGASSFKLQWQAWPKDILLRQNSLTSNWIDVADRYAATHIHSNSYHSG
jgi:hypothetical protein